MGRALSARRTREPRDVAAAVPSVHERAIDGLAAYVSGIIGSRKVHQLRLVTCNLMLRAQMLATALDVYFSDPALGGNKIGAYYSRVLGESATPQLEASISTSRTSVRRPTARRSSGSCGEDASGVFRESAPCRVPHGSVHALRPEPLVRGSSLPTTVQTGTARSRPSKLLAKDAFDAINNKTALIVPVSRVRIQGVG